MDEAGPISSAVPVGLSERVAKRDLVQGLLESKDTHCP